MPRRVQALYLLGLMALSHESGEILLPSSPCRQRNWGPETCYSFPKITKTAPGVVTFCGHRMPGPVWAPDCFSNLVVNVNHLSVLLKCRF